jgi:hypothetical protein
LLSRAFAISNQQDAFAIRICSGVGFFVNADDQALNSRVCDLRRLLPLDSGSASSLNPPVAYADEPRERRLP